MCNRHPTHTHTQMYFPLSPHPRCVTALLDEASASPNQEVEESAFKALLRRRKITATEEESDAVIGVLLQNCIIQREGLGRFSAMIPFSGPFQKQLREGRKDLTNVLSKRKFQEILEAELRKKKLKGTSLGVDFHVLDLCGAGVVEKKETPAGPVLRLTAAKAKK